MCFVSWCLAPLHCTVIFIYILGAGQNLCYSPSCHTDHLVLSQPVSPSVLYYGVSRKQKGVSWPTLYWLHVHACMHALASIDDNRLWVAYNSLLWIVYVADDMYASPIIHTVSSRILYAITSVLSGNGIRTPRGALERVTCSHLVVLSCSGTVPQWIYSGSTKLCW